MINRLYTIINKLSAIINKFYIVIDNIYIYNNNKLFTKKKNIFLLIILKINMKNVKDKDIFALPTIFLV